MKRKYDIAFGCGYACAVTQALRAADLQFASYPFDWTSTPGIVQAARAVASGFDRWMEREDLELVAVIRAGLNKHVYLDRRDGFGFVHDFSSFSTFDESYPGVKEKYDRRIKRMMDDLSSARRVLAVAAEWPYPDRRAERAPREAKRLFEEKFPGVEFDILYIHCVPGKNECTVEESGGGVTVASYDYRTYTPAGELDHVMDNKPLVAFLRDTVEVPDRRTEAEKAAYVARWKKQDAERWKGRNWLETLVNRTRYRRYRRLEKFLVAKGLVPPERPLFDPLLPADPEGGA